MSQEASSPAVPPRPKFRGWGEPEGYVARLILVRHGEVDERQRELLYGAMDVDLSERGREMSRLTAQALAGAHRVDAIITSDLKRASFLADELAGLTGLDAVRMPEFRERHFGTWQGRLMEDIRVHNASDYAEYVARRWEMRLSPGAENFEDLGRRVHPVIAKLIPSNFRRTIVLVSHSGPMRSIIGDALLLEGRSLFRIRLDYCSITILDYYSDGPVVMERLNDRHHLAALGKASATGLGVA